MRYFSIISQQFKFLYLIIQNTNNTPNINFYLLVQCKHSLSNNCYTQTKFPNI